MTKPKLYYTHITRTYTHCYINWQSSDANPFFLRGGGGGGVRHRLDPRLHIVVLN